MRELAAAGRPVMSRLKALQAGAAASRALRLLFALLIWSIPVAFILWLASLLKTGP
jgi:hypothetical protein